MPDIWEAWAGYNQRSDHYGTTEAYGVGPGHVDGAAAVGGGIRAARVARTAWRLPAPIGGSVPLQRPGFAPTVSWPQRAAQLVATAGVPSRHESS